VIWIGPHEDEVDHMARLTKPLPPERWPWGPPSWHEDSCLLHRDHDEMFAIGRHVYCDCMASDPSTEESET
jgi:hypothetical protein